MNNQENAPTVNSIKINKVAKAILYPRFGKAIISKRIAMVRNDLPAAVQRFVIAHERFHIDDPARAWLWREIRANAAGAVKHPGGFFLACLLSLAPYRIQFYIRRAIRGS